MLVKCEGLCFRALRDSCLGSFVACRGVDISYGPFELMSAEHVRPKRCNYVLYRHMTAVAWAGAILPANVWSHDCRVSYFQVTVYVLASISSP